MKGIYNIELYNNRVHYFLSLRRNITVLQGDSATGKSELIRLLSTYNARKESSGITLICERICTVLTDEDWEERLERYSGRIIFADEGNKFLKSKRFAELIKHSDNYFVLITRDSLFALPYSIEEIYALKESGSKYSHPNRVYNEMERLYTNISGAQDGIVPDEVIVEDSNSGFDFFNHVVKGQCFSARGKSNVEGLLEKRAEDEKTILAVVDGAAFGPEMRACMRVLRWSKGNFVLYAPESFEYLLLLSGIVDSVPRGVLEKTWEYADSSLYFSWEEFFTQYLIELTRNTIYQYSKKKLNDNWLTSGNVRRVLDIIPTALHLISKPLDLKMEDFEGED